MKPGPLLLPAFATIVVPVWITRRWGTIDTRWAGTIPAIIGQLAGGVIFLAGLALFVWCVSLFTRVGQGTLAPWDPTRRLVSVGPYRYTRNPMITAVAAILTGAALYRGSIVLGAWTVLFIAINHVYFIFSEEPGLERRFGADYIAYMKRVPRWVPRMRR